VSRFHDEERLLSGEQRTKRLNTACEHRGAQARVAYSGMGCLSVVKRGVHDHAQVADYPAHRPADARQ
jgi:hypothetical protein